MEKTENVSRDADQAFNKFKETLNNLSRKSLLDIAESNLAKKQKERKNSFLRQQIPVNSYCD
ncbi:MAG: hypothetical protein ACLFSE_03820 [Spirochaetia bacterium]